MGAHIMTRAGFDPAAMVAFHTLTHWSQTLVRAAALVLGKGPGGGYLGSQGLGEV